MRRDDSDDHSMYDSSDPTLTLARVLAVIITTVGILLMIAGTAWGDCTGTCEHNYRECVSSCLKAGADTKCDRKCDERQTKCKAKCPSEDGTRRMQICEERWGRDMDSRGKGDKGILGANWRFWRCMDAVSGAEGPGCGRPPLPPCQPKPRPVPKPTTKSA